jgi:hypothetical protein
MSFKQKTPSIRLAFSKLPVADELSNWLMSEEAKIFFELRSKLATII